MNFRFLFIVIFLHISLLLSAQNSNTVNSVSKPGINIKAIGQISGTIIDSVTREHIEYSTVALYNALNDELVTGTISQRNGKFYLEKVAPGNYYLKISFLGYAEKIVPDIEITIDDPIVELKKIKLSSSSTKLDEVVIDGSSPRIDFQIDKKVINVSKQLTTISGTAVDVLENIPSVNVDIEGNVSLRGSTGFTVLIDGRPSVLDANEALQQIPATSIENVEIITNPSAKFDPDGTAGIINVITKKNKLQGFSGIVNMNVGLGDKYGGDILLNFKKRNLNMYVGIDYSMRNHPGESISENRTFSSDTTYYTVMEGTTDRQMERYGIKAGVDYSISSTDVISLSARYGNRSMDGKSVSAYDEWIDPVETNDIYTSLENSERGGGFYALNANYQHDFKKEGHKVLFDFSFNERQSNDKTYNQLIDSNNDTVEGKKNYESGPGKRIRAKLDYTYPINNTSKIEAGWQSQFGRSHDNTELWNLDTTSGIYVIQEEFTNKTDYNRDIHSVYGIYMGEWGDLGYQTGLRGEYTYRKIESEVQHETSTIDRWDLFPSLHISYQLPNDHQLMASYSRRIQRSRGWYLEPFITWVDAYNVRQGNPDLLPEYIDSYEFGYLKDFKKKNMVSLEAYYRVTNNKVEHIKSVYKDNIMLTTPENVGSDYSLGLEFLMTYSIFKWWDIDLMGNYYNYKVEGKLNGTDFSNQTNSWSSRFNNTFNIGKSAQFQLNSMYNGPSVTAQGKTEGFYVINAAVKKDFMDRKVSAVLQVRDIFGTAKRESYSSGDDFWSYRKFTQEAPVVMLNLSYRFNNYKTDRRQRQSGGDDVIEEDM